MFIICCFIDRHGKFVQVNQVCERTCGYQPEELIGHHFTEFVYPDDRAKTLSIVKQTVADLRYMAAAEAVTIHMDIEPMHNFYSDRGRLAVVLRNIIANAIHYKIPGKEISIYISVFFAESKVAYKSAQK